MAGTSRVAKAPPDGYQFVLGNLGTHAANQTFYKTPLYNAATDFAPVMLIAQTPLVLLARKDLPAGNLSEFIAFAKENQATMQYGSGGAGSASHLACALLNAAIDVNITHVPYRGAAPAMQGASITNVPTRRSPFLRFKARWSKQLRSSRAIARRACPLRRRPTNKA
jgi:tripartite-type tricarboxylate transporter receptor subunit TctC